MHTADIIRLEDHRKSAAPAASPDRESPAADARRAPDPVANRCADIDIFHPALWHYPPPEAVVQWFPARWPVARILDTAIEGLRLFAIASVAAIVAGTVLASLAGAAALAVGG